MKAFVFGVEPEPVDAATSDNPLVRMLAQTPMRLMEVDDPGFLLPDWVVCAPRLTGICGSDSKQVFMDWGEVERRQPDDRLHVVPAHPRARGRRRRRGARARRPKGSRSGSASCSTRGCRARRAA